MGFIPVKKWVKMVKFELIVLIAKIYKKNQFSTIFSPFLTPPPNVFDKVIYNYKKKLFFFFFFENRLVSLFIIEK